MNISTIVGVILCALFVIYGIRTGIFSSQQAMEQFLGRFGIWGPVLFVLIQIVQVVIPIIPGGVSCLAGVLIFGPVMGFVYNYIGISIGSVGAFLISRRYGASFVRSMVKQKTYDKYIGWLNRGKRFERLFAIAIAAPCAPDDFLCYLAGLTSMKLKHFTGIIALCKPPSIIAYSLGLAGVVQVVQHMI